ncbi:Rpn family recombination-promoting nuclease/putative transposase [Clostridium sp. MCC353]|uniref:Rpn family recombination-promoting nuclease/putative transposase n=1 Tax=Clostridium sp. MCC353 TaxID=2592646 RepID=UPI001C00B134|nr:Rpn family recombination-promoting nuclease/putative transposase [Clostridium sp. MCC353]MBT9777761.1 Rpn family recombination-promoting nuclease/putative transposase [Clostridium sp. MCC353]
MNQTTKMKPLQDLTLLDRFLFSVAMEDSAIFESVLEIILGEDIHLLNSVQTEKELRTSPLLRSIRMDVYSMDEKTRIYNMEAQKKNTGNLPKRSRYYQALLDSNLLEPGSVDFNRLNPCYLIMITPFDLFGLSRYRYTFQMSCLEHPSLLLEDGSVRIFLNTHGTDPENNTPELIDLLNYMEHTNQQCIKDTTSSKIKELHKRICTIKSNEEIGVRYMQAWEEKVMEREEWQEEGAQIESTRYSQLILNLARDGKNELIIQAAADPELLKKLYQEYQL